MNEDTQPRLCFSYLRFSRAEQARGDSTKRQTALRDDYCHRHGLTLDSSRMISDEGVSGYHGRNSVEGNLAQFHDQIKAGQIPPGSVLLIESLDRLDRDQIRSARNRFEEILEAGVEVHTLSSPQQIYNKDSLSDPHALTGMVWEFARAFEYSKQLGTRVGAAWKSKREKARTEQTPLTRRPPAWLEVVDGHYQVIEKRRKTVELIYELCVDGLGIDLIAKELTRRQIPTFPVKTSTGKTITGKKWTETYVKKILVGEAPIGHHQPTRIDPATRKPIPTELIRGLFPPVVSETLNAQAKVALRNRRNKGGRIDYENGKIRPFSGLLQTHSGASLRIRYRTPSRKDPTLVPYLVDQSNGNGYPLQNFEVLMLGWLTNMDPKPIGNLPIGQGKEITGLEAQIANLDHRIQAFTEKVNSGEPFESFLNILSTAEKDRKLARQRLQELRAITPIGQGLTAMSSIIERLGSLDPNHLTDRPREITLALRAALRRIVERIEVTIGQEGRTWKTKSLRVTTTFRDGVKVEFNYRPL